MKQIRLDDLDKKVPFEVPEDYFDNLTSSIQEKISDKPKRQWIPSGQLAWALASGFIILIAVLFFLPDLQDDSALSSEELLAQVTDQDLIDYLDFNGISELELIEGLNDEDIDELWIEGELENLNLQSDDIDDILIDYELDNLL